MKKVVIEMSEEERKFFCPFCGAPDEELTYSIRYSKLVRVVVADVFCNSCGRAFLVIPLEEEEEKSENVEK